MDKNNWTHKKLGDICEIITKGTTPTTLGYNFTDDGINFIKIECIGTDRNLIKDKLNYISEECNKSMGRSQLQEKDLLFSIAGALGRIYIVEKSVLPANTNQALSIIRLRNKQDLFLQYLSHFLGSNTIKEQIEKDKVGVAQLNLSLGQIRNFIIPIPPLAEQERIVAELDLLSSIIEKKKAQLKELDQLAQSIFYDMFGDPITNEKGWEVKKFEEVCENCDSMRKPITAKDRIQGLIPYYGASGVVDYVKDYIFDGEYLLISEDGANLLARSTPIAFSIKGKTWVNNHAHVLKFSNKSVQQYVEFTINLRDISSIVTGCAQPKLTQANLNRMPIPFPPLPLQQEFASKVEAIERQKSLIQQSIVETQTLFDSRMDYWFG